MLSAMEFGVWNPARGYVIAAFCWFNGTIRGGRKVGFTSILLIFNYGNVSWLSCTSSSTGFAPPLPNPSLPLPVFSTLQLFVVDCVSIAVFYSANNSRQPTSMMFTKTSFGGLDALG